ncbi:DUF3576 domain-containing protein [Pelagibacteraceae bacterium]|nr:DUF3576 domain-containing protein [Pelagibacteraceae bacterium]
MLPKYKINSNTGFLRFFVNIFTIFLLFFALACSIPKFAKPSKVKNNIPVNAKERARQNINEGRGISLKGLTSKGRGTTYEFSTSNPLWRASLEIIDFMPLATVDYSGGIIITDWYGDSQNANESIKITIRFLSNEIQSNSIRVIVHNKKCRTEEQCTVNQINSNIKNELQSSIIKKAAQFDRDAKNSKK